MTALSLPLRRHPRESAAGLALSAARSAARLTGVIVTVLALASILTFALGVMTDSNPAAAVLGQDATAADIARMEHQFGLDRPVWEQYLSWVAGAVQGDLGKSWFTSIPVTHSLAAAIPVDLAIAGLALLLATVIGAGAGIAAAQSNGGVVDRTVTVVCSFVATLPPFLIGMALIVIFAVKLQVLPSGGYIPPTVSLSEWLRFAILPSLALSLDTAAAIARQLRTALVAAQAENYATGAIMRGFSARRVLFGHVLRNAIAPTLAVIGLAVPAIIGGAVITEKIFNLPGIAQLALDSAERGDVPVVLGALLVTVFVVLVASTTVNLAQTALNPLARRGQKPAGGPT